MVYAAARVDIYTHIRIVIGIVIGLGLTHLLRGMARLIEHPKREGIWWVHLVWVLSIFLYLIHFWWFEFELGAITHWNFPIYLFLILYAVLLYVLCALLFPEDISDYRGFRDYFMARRHWFFGVLALVFVLDFADTWLKGSAHFVTLGPEYVARGAVFIALSLVAIGTRNTRYHAAFAVFGVVYQVTYMVRLYYVQY
ncbi:MAG TPA: hypothetical protein VHA71_04660 [Rhodanobacteraceae bacterium]|jgi:hypothetical protein|nr:hypothetical protein [Rhodanobacteraceae bacterium]